MRLLNVYPFLLISQAQPYNWSYDTREDQCKTEILFINYPVLKFPMGFNHIRDIGSFINLVLNDAYLRRNKHR